MAGTRQLVRDLAAERPLARVVASFFLYAVTEHGVWIAILAYAYGRGGATESGVVALVQVLPAAALAPVLSTVADRRSPALLLKGGYVVQTVGMALVSVGMNVDAPVWLTYGAAVVMTLGVVTTRPALATLTPSLTRDARQLATANVSYGWLDSVGLVAGSLITALGLAVSTAALVFAIMAVLGAIQVALTWTIRVNAIAVEQDSAPGPLASAAAGLRALAGNARARVLVGLIAAVYVVVGGLDVLFVVVTFATLHQDASWVGYFSAGFGVGGVLAGLVTSQLIGRRMRGPIIAAVAGVAVAVALASISTVAGITLGLFVLAGAGKAIVLVATQMLLQRVVPPDLIGRIFGVVEALLALGLAAGSLLVPLLVGLGGGVTALIGVAAVLPLAAAAGWRSIRTIDAGASVPVVEIALLRSLPHFAVLPVTGLEALAHALTPLELADGDVLVREGDAGDTFYAVAGGSLAIWSAGRRIASRGRGDGIGEIALLRRSPRTATVIADGPVSLFALQGQDFLGALTGHRATYTAASAVAADYLGE